MCFPAPTLFAALHTADSMDQLKSISAASGTLCAWRLPSESLMGAKLLGGAMMLRGLREIARE